MNAHDGMRCTWETCGELPTFVDIAGFLAHAANVHHYELHIKLERIPKRRRAVSGWNTIFQQLQQIVKIEPIGHRVGKIGPRLLAASNTKSNETYRRSQRLNSHW